MTASVDDDLLAILACPSDDHAPLRRDGDGLICSYCASRFRIDDGIPVMLESEARRLDPEPGAGAHAAGASGR